MTLKTRTLTKAFPILFALVFVLVSAAPVDAQHQHQNQRADTTQGMMKGDMTKGEQGMMKGDMMQGMMQMMDQMMKDPLRRSAMLVHMLPTMQEPLTLSDDQVARMNEHAQEFNEQREALIKATASQMEAVLSAQQRTMLSEMKPMQMHQHMMANMSMMEMMQTGMMNKQKR